MATRKRTRKPTAARLRAAVANTQEQMLDTVHQVWLAGLGAFSKAQRGAPKLFDELVKEGARVHSSARKSADKAVRSVVMRAQTAIEGRVGSARAKAADTLENLEKVFQSRVQRALHQMGVPGTRDIEKLSARVNALNTSIEKLARRRVTARGGDGRRAAAPPPSAAH
ncbi:MAG TPA: phasin family protein [Steroidobacteraceae bacterium]|nr:phasin family protein [Steroidobacteraceae bacterium]